jgi:hypothetical protein
MVIMYADFSAAVAPQMYVGDACASFQKQLEFLEPAKFIRLAGDDDSKLKLASLPTCLRLPCPDRTFAVFMMVMIMAVIAVVMIIVVITMMMIMAVMAPFDVRMTFVVMRFAMRVVMIMTASSAVYMPGFVIVIVTASGAVNVLFFVR